VARDEELVEIETSIGAAIFARELDHLLAGAKKVDVGRAEPT